VPEALVRATVIAGARQITGTVKDVRNNFVSLPSWYPNYAIGFGRAVLDRTLYVTFICIRCMFCWCFGALVLNFVQIHQLIIYQWSCHRVEQQVALDSEQYSASKIFQVQLRISI
jgi:hypothetical protein